MTVSRFLIYGLRDPRTREIRYVGKSTRGKERPQDHTSPSARKKHSHKAHWISDLMKNNLRPEIVILQQCLSNDELDSAERFWIAIGRVSLGKRFANVKDGGGGQPKIDYNIEAARRCLELNRIQPDFIANHLAGTRSASQRPEVRAARRITLTDPVVRAASEAARKLPAAVERHRKAVTEMVNRPEVRARLDSPEVKAILRASLNKTRQRHDVQQKIRDGLRTAMARPDVRAKHLEALSRPEVKQKAAEARRVAIAEPAVRAKKSASMKRTMAVDPALRKRCIAATHTPEAQAKATAAKQTEEYRTERSLLSREIIERPGMREQISASAKAVWDRPGYREKWLAARAKARQERAKEAAPR